MKNVRKILVPDVQENFMIMNAGISLWNIRMKLIKINDVGNMIVIMVVATVVFLKSVGFTVVSRVIWFAVYITTTGKKHIVVAKKGSVSSSNSYSSWLFYHF